MIGVICESRTPSKSTNGACPNGDSGRARLRLHLAEIHGLLLVRNAAQREGHPDRLPTPEDREVVQRRDENEAFGTLLLLLLVILLVVLLLVVLL